MSAFDFTTLSPTQQRVIRRLARAPNHNDQIAGYGAAPLLSAANALVRKGILTSHHTGKFWIAREYRDAADAYLTAWRATQLQKATP